MLLEVGKTYSCRNSKYFGKVYTKYTDSSKYVFGVEFYKLGEEKVIAKDSVTREGRRYWDTTDFLDLVAPLDGVCLGELK